MSPSPYYTTTPRYGLRSLLGTSNVDDIDAGFLAALDDVENAFTGYKSGTHAARLAATNLDGLLWRETDTGLLYLGTGAAWLDLGIPGAWQPLTLATNIVAVSGDYVPSARLKGDRVELKGVLFNNTGGSIVAGATVATVPTSMRPASPILSFGAFADSGAKQVAAAQVSTGGVLAPWGATWGAVGYCGLDGISYSLT